MDKSWTREKEIKDIPIVLRNRKIELFSTEIKTGGLGGIFFFFFLVGAEIKSFMVGMLSLRQRLGYQVELGTHFNVHIWNSGQFHD